MKQVTETRAPRLAPAFGGSLDDEIAAPELGEGYVVFSLGDQRYGLALDCVLEVQQIVAMSAAPEGALGVMGLVNLRGDVVPAVDLATLLGLPSAEKGLDAPMLFVSGDEGSVVAFVVDAVHDVSHLPAEWLKPTPASHPLASAMRAVACGEDDGLVYLLEAEPLLGRLRLVA